MFYPRFQHFNLWVLPLEVRKFLPEMTSFYVDLPTVMMPISDECKRLIFKKVEVYLIHSIEVVFLQSCLYPDSCGLIV